MAEQSFLKALFFGVIAEDILFPYPELNDPERTRLYALLDGVKKLEVDPVAIDEAGQIPDALMAQLKELGLFGLNIPVEYGGLGLSSMAHARVIDELARIDGSLALMLTTHGAIGTNGILLYGNEEQKQRYLPRLARGELIAAFALTEHSSGADAGVVRTHAKLDESRGVYVLNGEKPWVSNGAIANLFLVFARTSEPEQGHKPRMVSLLVERGPGVETGRRHSTLGMRGVHINSIGFHDVVVPEHDRVGELGQGFKVAMEVLNDARLAMSAAMVGQCRSVVSLSLERLHKRRSFGRAIGEFPILKDKVSKMMADSYAVESMVYLSCGLADRRVEDYSLESAVSRVAASESLWRIVNEAMQVAAGTGFVKPHPIERRMRDARAHFVVDGTNEVLRCFIALSGMRGPGKEMSGVVGAMHEPLKGFGLLRDFAVRKVREALRRERVTRCHELLGEQAALFEELTDELSRAVERALRKHGQEIAEMQYTQMRVANIVIDLYALAACLSRTTLLIERRGEVGAGRQIDLTRMFARAAEGRMRASLARLETNDDELRKSIAARAYTDGSYSFDVV